MSRAPALSGPVVGLLLAGGLSQRMGGGDKCLRAFRGRPLLAAVIERAAPQVDRLVVNANGPPERFAPFGLPVAPDTVGGRVGPLAGVLTGMEWAAERVPGCAWVATFATDAPFLPRDLVSRLAAACTDEGAEMACAASGGRAHPVFGLWPVELRGALRTALVDERIRKVDAWTARYRCAVAEFEAGEIDPFFNVNEPEDLVRAERIGGG